MDYSQETIDCCICLQTMVDPVTTSCGHSYCSQCINAFWDENNNNVRSYFCPQCRHTFSSRPFLTKNTLLASLLEERARTNHAAAAAYTYAAPGDVPCDACTGRKRKAWMFCPGCQASYCETHLKPHFELEPFKKHNLIQASTGIRDRICGRHGRPLEIFCRSDQQFVCPLCVDEHQGHDMGTVAAETREVQKQLDQGRKEVADRVQDSMMEMAELRKAADRIRDAAWTSSDDIERLCAERIRIFVRSVEMKRSAMRAKVGEAEKAGVDWTHTHLGQLEREVFELRKREQELHRLSLTEDPIRLLQDFRALGGLPVFTDSRERLNMLTKFTAAQTDQLKNMCSKEKEDLFSHCDKNMLAESPCLPEKIISRTRLLNGNKNFTVEVDPNTVTACLHLSETNREISWSDRDQAHPDHQDRFTFYQQALAAVGLEESHYWEAEWDGGIVDLAVSYKGIGRKGSGSACCFGHNEISWKLSCLPFGCTFWHNGLHKGQIPPVPSRRVGIHLDKKAGTLSFYSVLDSQSVIQLLKIKTTFTEPLYPGFSLDLGSTLRIC
ncbi:tripartite motif-containing protein 16-like isoform X1 [Pungitius pungitius]|uniref:tripartite motif-containing protein 16-like isoform X1 n=1 Tax=Pungitius pungitius TaxID=134920 RepID=UPI002E158E65